MSEPESASLDTRRRRLLYRATHRGTQENDILFGGFVRRHIGTFSELELADVEALLEVPDNELADWLTGRIPLPADAAEMLRRICEEAGQACKNPPSPCGRGTGGGEPSSQPPPARGGGESVP
jgi:antitoxin CptB